MKNVILYDFYFIEFVDLFFQFYGSVIPFIFSSVIFFGVKHKLIIDEGVFESQFI